MTFPHVDSPAAWRVSEIEQDKGWIFRLSDAARAQLAAAVQAAFDPDRPLFDYRGRDIDLGPALDTIRDAAKEAHAGRGVSLVKGLPRDELTEQEFRFMNWAIGLHLGVARPQGIKSQYISEVRAVGHTYRAANGRGNKSNAGLDFHTDGCDLVTLACFNKAKSGGQSMVSSSITAWNILREERPDLAEVALGEFYFSRNTEQAPDEGPYYGQPLFDMADGHMFGKWNRNRVRTAQDIEGVPQLTDAQKECTDLLDDILRRPEVMFTMWLEPGDLQLMNNHVMLHSRTPFEDFEEEGRQRLLYRLWLATPNSLRLPESWGDYFRSIEPGTVRGG
ncbi:MAG: TauD/TfdA family dioxygenase, partial [Rhodospirillales bacterium]